MNKKLLNIAMILLAGVGISLTSCNKEIDESNLYTATGLTIEDVLQANDDTLSLFNQIMARTGYDRQMSSYGEYTCFAPVNSGVRFYLDSLYNDPEAIIPHNGMTAPTVEGMSDSLCLEFVRYHIVDGKYTTLSMSGEGLTVPTMLGRPFTASTDKLGNTVLNSTSDIPATIIKPDTETKNGYVQICNSPIPYSSRRIADVLKKDGRFNVFYEALVRTGLADSLLASEKYHNGEEYTCPDHKDTNNDQLYFPKTCKIAYTVFAETDEVLKAKIGHGHDVTFDDLEKYCVEQYKNAAEWYQYPKEKGIKISTEHDYTNRFNVVNMFVAYHILKVGMNADQLVFEDSGKGITDTSNPWNYVWGGEPYDYYETMLPNTLMKIWQPISTRGTDENGKTDATGKVNYINRYISLNTLTDEIGTMGTDAMHRYVSQGVRVNRAVLSAYNGYIHPIYDMLVYDRQVPQGVLNERLRFESTTFLPELINNGIRNASQDNIKSLNSGGSGSRVAFAQDYFDNVVCYTTGSTLRYNVRGAFRAYQADAFQGWGQYDLAIKLPHVPTGDYELRLFYSPMDHGGMMQFYLGESSNPQSMKSLSIPLDVRIKAADDRIGWLDASTEEDAGINTDVVMRNHGYMRAPISFRGHPGNDNEQHKTGKVSIPHGSTIAEINGLLNGDNNCRTDGTVTLRRILTRQTFYQSQDYWFRIKSVINDDTDLKWQVDFVELVPISVVDNDKYSEDWY